MYAIANTKPHMSTYTYVLWIMVFEISVAILVVGFWYQNRQCRPFINCFILLIGNIDCCFGYIRSYPQYNHRAKILVSGDNIKLCYEYLLLFFMWLFFRILGRSLMQAGFGPYTSCLLQRSFSTVLQWHLHLSCDLFRYECT